MIVMIYMIYIYCWSYSTYLACVIWIDSETSDINSNIKGDQKIYQVRTHQIVEPDP